ncbi:hypothetical protein [Flavobacterium muglaense]|nr:hypothetical protein [Flavobacterium muglaense]
MVNVTVSFWSLNAVFKGTEILFTIKAISTGMQCDDWLNPNAA